MTFNELKTEIAKWIDKIRPTSNQTLFDGIMNLYTNYINDTLTAKTEQVDTAISNADDATTAANTAAAAATAATSAAVTSASNSATSAAGSATSAAISASNAATSASAAQTAKTAAETAKTAAEAARDTAVANYVNKIERLDITDTAAFTQTKQANQASIYRTFTCTELIASTAGKKILNLIIDSGVNGGVTIYRCSISSGALVKHESLHTNVVVGENTVAVNMVLAIGELIAVELDSTGSVLYGVKSGSQLFQYDKSTGALLDTTPNNTLSISYTYKLLRESTSNETLMYEYWQNRFKSITDLFKTDNLVVESKTVQTSTSSDIYPGFGYTSTEFFFATAKKIKTLIIQSKATGTLTVRRCSYVGTTITVIDQTDITIDKVGTFEYPYRKNLDANTMLLFNVSTASVLTYGSKSGKSMYAYNSTGGDIQNTWSNMTVGVGYVEYSTSTGATDLDKFIESVQFLSKYQRLRGKNYIAIGDSITYGDQISVDPITGLRMTYAALVAVRNGMRFTNYGVGGCFLSNNSYTADKTQAIINRIDAIITANPKVDYVSIFGGTNDCYGGATIEDDGSKNPNTFKGALKLLCEKLLIAYPTAKICFITPYNVSGPAINYRNAIISICADYGIPVFDAFANVGICPYKVTNLTLVGDGTHPTNLGHNKISDPFEAFMATL